MRIVRGESLGELAAEIATEIIRVFRERQAESAIPCIVLTGGTGGALVLEALGEHPDRDSVDWSRVRFVWGDERWRPAGDPERNDLLADSTLFAHVSVDPALVHRVSGSNAGLSLEDAAAAYARIIDGIHRIDIALNGVGEDGHIASLFPGRPEMHLTDAPSAFAITASPKPPPERVTLSMPTLQRAERVWLIAAGAGKADAVRAVRQREQPLLPAATVTGTRETVLWADLAALGES